MPKLVTRSIVAAVSIASLSVAGIAAAPSASALSAATVCAENLYVREQPQGVVIGTLYKGDHFDIDRYSPSRQYVYGHAYGNVHKDGWVQNGWFC